MKLKYELLLDVKPEVMYSDLSDINFLYRLGQENRETNKQNSIIYQDERLTEYELDIPGVGKWVSERIMVPEKLFLLTKRKSPLKPFKYMIILNLFEAFENGTKYTYIEEYMLDKGYEHETDKITSSIKQVMNRNRSFIENYYGKLIKEEV